MKVNYSKKCRHLPVELDRPDQVGAGVDHRLRWVARRCRVSLATAATLAANAGLFSREDR